MAHLHSPRMSPSMIMGGPAAAIKIERPTTPSPTAAPISKRDRRRTALADKLNEITMAFSQNRDAHYRQQMQLLQADMHLIMSADPYQNEPLDDGGEEIANMVDAVFGGPPGTVSMNGPNGQSVFYRPEVDEPAIKGRLFARYAEEVNNAKEERDAQLTMLHEQYEREEADLKLTAHYRIRTAQEEHRNLSGQLRDRLITTVNQKKNRLMREKDQLDISDSNALLLHPNQFSIVHPASPGGPQSNRKTRHTRHRADPDDGGPGAGEPASKKRRKTAAVEEPDVESMTGRARATDGRPSPTREAPGTLHATTPLYTVERLFTEKDLNMGLQAAAVAAAQQFTEMQIRTTGVATQKAGFSSDDTDNGKGSSGTPEGDSSDTPAAADMDRSANPSQHATRSNRNAAAALNVLGDIAVTHKTTFGVPIPLVISAGNITKAGTVPPLATAPTDQAAEDIRKITEGVRRGPAGLDRELLQRLCAPPFALPPPDEGELPNLPLLPTDGPGLSKLASSAKAINIIGGRPMSRNGAGSSRGRMMTRTASGTGIVGRRNGA
ncbi:MAG: NADPH:quinone reductase [Watsoniomyces obsoletus]|nr:MAG: NADPH:quinone reductase [Watsoniomyces obsoletus]